MATAPGLALVGKARRHRQRGAAGQRQDQRRFAAPPCTAVVELELTETVLMGATQRHRASFGSAAGLAFRLMHGRIIIDAIRAEWSRFPRRRSGRQAMNAGL